MGVNLVTIVRNFFIQQQTFSATDHDVQDGCVTPGSHRIMRFDFLSYNAGDTDFVIGSPASRPDLFVWSSGHGHYHLKDFNQFLLFNATGALATIGYKQAFCAIDIERIRPSAAAARFSNCNSDQGISAGWADVYNSGLPCQYIVIDGLPDGDYTLQSTTNSKHVAAEECFGDNTTWTGLRIAGNNVTVIDPPWLPEDRLAINPDNVGAVQVAGRWKVVDGSHWLIDTGTNQGGGRARRRGHQALRALFDVLCRSTTLWRRGTDDVFSGSLGQRTHGVTAERRPDRLQSLSPSGTASR